jgi:hypothetical protein
MAEKLLIGSTIIEGLFTVNGVEKFSSILPPKRDVFLS